MNKALHLPIGFSVVASVAVLSLVGPCNALAAASAQETPSVTPAIAAAMEGSGGSYAIQRFPENPIIRPEMLPGSDGDNITGPSLIEVPDWVPNRLGRYYLYFAAHHGSYIRMAYADQLQGPWTVYAPGVLTLEQVRQQAEKEAVATPKDGTPHVASPDVHVDHGSQKIRMYFHAKPVDPYIDWIHATGIAVSDDGLNFSLEVPRPVGEPYFRVFQFGGYHYAVANRARLHRSIDGINWEPTVSGAFAGAAYDLVTDAEPAHAALKLDGDVLTVFYTRFNDAPERVMASTVTLSGDWLTWQLGPPTNVAKPEMEYEGADLPIAQSQLPVCTEPMNALRDPAIYREGDRVYLLYACKCEVGGIAIGELIASDEVPAAVDLSVSQVDLPDPAAAGGTVTYRAVVANASTSDALYVQLVDRLPTNSTFVSAASTHGQCTRTDTAVVTCLLGTVPANATVTIDVVVKAGAAGSITNVVGVSGNEPDPDPSNNSHSESTTVNPSVTVTAPNTATVWQAGTSQSIRFMHNLGIGKQFALDLSRDGGVTWTSITTVTTTSATSGSYSWIVTAPATTQGRVRVTWAGDSAATDTSNVDFKITSRVKVTTPNTPVTWGAGSTRTITWTHNLGVSQRVDIAFSPNNGVTWSPIASGVVNATTTTGSYTGPMPSVVTTQGLIRVRSASNAVDEDVSDVPFTLAAPAITVSAPNSAVSWVVGTSRSITWTHNLGTAEAVLLEISRDGGSTWATLAASAANTGSTSGSFPWIVSAPLTTTARVRARWTRDHTVQDASNANFTIASAISVTAPNTAVSWAAGSTRTITWNHSLGAAQMFDVEFSANNGSTWTPVATGVPAATSGTGAYTAVMPSVVTTQGLVRVSPAGNSLLGDVSNTRFTLAAPTLTVTAPNTNVAWTIGASNNITWSHNLGTAESVAVDVSRDGGATWASIQAAVPNSTSTAGTLAWTVSGPVTTMARIRVTWKRVSSVFDISNANFKIQ